MSKERLLKRLRSWSLNPDLGFGDVDSLTYIQSLLDDLSNIYNTRQGTVMLDPRFGVPDFTSLMSNMGLPEIENLTKAFMTVTNKYEPRLANLNVTYQKREEDLGLIRFGVTSKIDVRGRLTPLLFDILLQGDGSVALHLPE